jgi:hypothetical protein
MEALPLQTSVPSSHSGSFSFSLLLPIFLLYIFFIFGIWGQFLLANLNGAIANNLIYMLCEGKGGGGPQRMSDEEESKVEVEENGKGGVVKEAQPPWIKLGLGIGACSAAPAQNPVSEHGKPASLTPAQSHELQGQALIYKHLEAGLPIPLHLLIPIWKSVASCFGPAIYDLYPSCKSSFSSFQMILSLFCATIK